MLAIYLIILFYFLTNTILSLIISFNYLKDVTENYLHYDQTFYDLAKQPFYFHMYFLRYNYSNLLKNIVILTNIEKQIKKNRKKL